MAILLLCAWPLISNRGPTPAPLTKTWKNAPYEFAIGIYTGNSPIAIAPSAHIRNPVFTAEDITDFPARFVADPFVVRDGGNWYLFFEVLNAVNQQGDIAVAASRDGLKWTYKQVVLDEPFHLSYPQVFQWGTNWYMLPEAGRSGQVRLYRAVEFPWKWQYATNLLDGAYVDASLLNYNGRWWLFTVPRQAGGTLYLFSADQPTGPWKPHPDSPLIVNNHNIARPGGRMIVYKGNPIRYAQDDDPSYGNALHAFTVTTLTQNSYAETAASPCPLLTASGTGWNGLGMHQIDPMETAPGQWRAYVDGLGWARPERWTDATFTNRVKLDGFSVRPARLRAGAPVLLRFFWSNIPSNAPPPTAFVHIGRTRKEILLQADYSLNYPAECYEQVMKTPANLPPGKYELRVGLCETAGGRKIPAEGKSCSHQVARIKPFIEIIAP